MSTNMKSLTREEFPKVMLFDKYVYVFLAPRHTFT